MKFVESRCVPVLKPIESRSCRIDARNTPIVDVAEEMMRLTRTVVLRALLGGDLGPFGDRIDRAWSVINE